MIPANDSNVEVVSESTLGSDVKLVYIQPHAHLRGKDFEIRVVYPTGEKETVFKGKFDFNWQLGYDLAKPILVPRGTKIVSIAHYDNSANNPNNPDPTKEIHWGPPELGRDAIGVSGLHFPGPHGHCDSVEGVRAESAFTASAGRRRTDVSGTRS